MKGTWEEASLAFSLSNKTLASKQNPSHFILILEDDVQCCGTTVSGGCPWAHSHPGAQLGELTGLFHLNAPFIVNNHHFNNNSLPAGSPSVMPLSSVGTGDWGGEGCVGYLMDSFTRATFSSSPCAQNTTIWEVWVDFGKVLFTHPTTAPNTLLKIIKAHTPAHPWSL